MAKAESNKSDGPKADAQFGAKQAAKLVGIKLKDVFAWKDYGDKVVVVTVAGQKLEAAKS